MDGFLLNPNIAYLLLVSGFLIAILAILTPGTGWLEGVAFIAFLLAGWSIYNLPINLWALIILLLGVFPFILAVRKSRKHYLLIVSVLALVVGSAFLFRSEGWQPAVNPFLALVVSLLVGGYFWVAVHKTLEAEHIPPSHDLAALISTVGEAKSDILTEGSVQVDGELWSARSLVPISSGSKVRVTQRDGFILVVEPYSEPGALPTNQER